MISRALTDAQISAAIEYVEGLLDGCESGDGKSLAVAWQMFERANPKKASAFSPVPVAA